MQLSINTDQGPGGGNAGTFAAVRHYGPQSGTLGLITAPPTDKMEREASDTAPG